MGMETFALQLYRVKVCRVGRCDGGELGRQEACRQNTERAVQGYAQLAAESPDERRYRAGQARALQALGNSYGRTEQAGQYFREALALHEQRVREDPASADYA